MSAKVTFDYSKAGSFISAGEIEMMKEQTLAAKEKLVSKTGAGSDFLGWITLPDDYDKEEYARSNKQRTTVKIAALGNDAGIIGAAMLGF